MGKKIVLNETQLRKYIRSIIRESLVNEATSPALINRWLSMTPEQLDSFTPNQRQNPEEFSNLVKMLKGEPYDRSVFPVGSTTLAIENAYREKMGYPPLARPAGGVRPRLIDADGSDITPENSEENRMSTLERGKDNKRTRERQQFVKAHEREGLANSLGIDDEDEIRNLTIDKAMGDDVEDSPHAKSWLAMSPEEREAESERIRKSRVQKSADDANRIRDSFKSLEASRTTSISRKTDLEQHMAFLRQRIADLKEFTNDNEYDTNNPNKRRIAELERILADDQRIYAKITSEKRKLRKPVDASDDDQAVLDAMRDADNNPDIQAALANDMEEFGDDLQNPSNFEPVNLGQDNGGGNPFGNWDDDEWDDDMIDFDDDEDADEREERMKDARGLGFFDDDEY